MSKAVQKHIFQYHHDREWFEKYKELFKPVLLKWSDYIPRPYYPPKGDLTKPGVYVIQYPVYQTNRYKIGFSNNPRRRIKAFNTACGSEPSLALVWNTPHYQILEKWIHLILDLYRPDKSKEHFYVPLHIIVGYLNKLVSLVEPLSDWQSINNGWYEWGLGKIEMWQHIFLDRF